MSRPPQDQPPPPPPPLPHKTPHLKPPQQQQPSHLKPNMPCHPSSPISYFLTPKCHRSSPISYEIFLTRYGFQDSTEEENIDDIHPDSGDTVDIESGDTVQKDSTRKKISTTSILFTVCPWFAHRFRVLQLHGC